MNKPNLELTYRQLFGKNIKNAMKKKNISSEELAERIGKSEGTVSQLRRGLRFTTIPVLLELCKVLEVTPNDLLLQFMYEKPAQVDESLYGELVSTICQLKESEIKMLLSIIDAIISNRL